MLIEVILYYFPGQVSVYGRFHIPITIIPKGSEKKKKTFELKMADVFYGFIVVVDSSKVVHREE